MAQETVSPQDVQMKHRLTALDAGSTPARSTTVALAETGMETAVAVTRHDAPFADKRSVGESRFDGPVMVSTALMTRCGWTTDGVATLRTRNSDANSVKQAKVLQFPSRKLSAPALVPVAA